MSIKKLEHIHQVSTTKSSERMTVVIDDSDCLARKNQPSREYRAPCTAEQLQGIVVCRNIPVLAVWPALTEDRGSSPQAWSDKVTSADAILVMENDSERTKKLTEANQAVNLHIVKNPRGEEGKLTFDFFPAFSKFVEA